MSTCSRRAWLVLLAAAFAGVARAQEKADPAPVAAAVAWPTPPAAAGALAPNLSVHDGRVLLSWLEPAGDERSGGHRMRFAVLDGDRFGEPRTVVESRRLFVNWADFPSVVAGAGETLLAHWLERTDSHAYDVVLARSTDGGQTWQRLGSPHRDGTKTEHGFVSILREGAGFRVFWLDGRAMAASENPLRMELRTAVVTERIGEERVLDGDVCTCCQTSAVVAPGGPLCVYRDHGANEVRDISIVGRAAEAWLDARPVADDGWEIPGCPVNGPSIDADSDRVAVAWFTAAAPLARVLVAFSDDGGRSFGEPIVVDDRHPLGRAGVACVDGGAAVVWLGVENGAGAVQLRCVRADGGAGPALRLGATAASRASGFPRVVRVGERLVVAWRETGDPARIQCAVLPVAAVCGDGRR